MKLSGSIFVSTAILLLGVTVARGAAILAPAAAHVRSLPGTAVRSPASFRLHPPFVAKYQDQLREIRTVFVHRVPVLYQASAVELNRFGLRRVPVNAAVAGREARESR